MDYKQDSQIWDSSYMFSGEKYIYFENKKSKSNICFLQNALQKKCSKDKNNNGE